jgi:hypothetical protein
VPLTRPNDNATPQVIARAARSETDAVLLQIDCVDADRPPGASWEVYVSAARVELNEDGPYLVGNIALFGDGIKTERQKPYTSFTFALDRAINASPDPSALLVTFVPSSGVVVDGGVAPALVKAPVRIRAMTLLVEKGDH